MVVLHEYLAAKSPREQSSEHRTMNRRRFLQHLSAASLGAAALPLLASPVAAQWFRRWPYDDPKAFAGQDTFNRLVALAAKNNWKDMPIGAMIGVIGLQLRGTPYVGATLEIYDDREVCSVNLLGLDCVTFFESALGFARMVKKGGSAPADLLAEITYTRYRGGRLGDYTTRLHYTADWFFDNEEKRVVRNITNNLPGAVRFTRRVDFMSNHPDSYRQLKANPAMVPVIAGFERDINSREMYYVPKEKVAAAEPFLNTGDIIGITTTINGIDCSHTGLCYRDEKNVLRFLHASLTKKEVTLDDELSVYLNSVSKHTGIMVVRPMEVVG